MCIPISYFYMPLTLMLIVIHYACLKHTVPTGNANLNKESIICPAVCDVA